MRAARWSVTLGQQRDGASVIGPVPQPVITFDSGVRIADDRGEPGLRPETLALNDRLGQVAQTTTPPGSTWAHLRVRGHLPSSQPSPRADDRQKSHAAIDAPVGVVVGRRLVASKVGVDCSLETVRHGFQCPQSRRRSAARYRAGHRQASLPRRRKGLPAHQFPRRSGWTAPVPSTRRD